MDADVSNSLFGATYLGFASYCTYELISERPFFKAPCRRAESSSQRSSALKSLLRLTSSANRRFCMH